MSLVLIGLGANLPAHDGSTPAETLQRAAAAIAALPGLSAPHLSRLWSSPAWPPSDQPDYVNAVLRLAGTADPGVLLAALHRIEARFGRVRGERNAARTLDLDILAIGGLVRSAPPPVLPHPRMSGRAFVLAPLAEVAPEWVHPVTGQSVASLLAALPAGEAASCRPLAPPLA